MQKHALFSTSKDAIWQGLLLMYDLQYETISMCGLVVSKTIKKVINT